jgi:hypothetical protein
VRFIRKSNHFSSVHAQDWVADTQPPGQDRPGLIWCNVWEGGHGMGRLLKATFVRLGPIGGRHGHMPAAIGRIMFICAAWDDRVPP